jgi:transcription antitermination factor NusG
MRMGETFEPYEPVWPEDLRQETRAECLARLAACPNPWSILLITPNMERRVAETLTEARLTVYVPIETYRPKPVNVARAHRPWRPRTRPLIPGYLFADLTDDRHLDIARANHAVRRIMCREGVPITIGAEDMRKIILDEAEGAFDFAKRASGASKGRHRGKRGKRGAGAEPSRWKSGHRVKVAEGPFAGFIGTIIKADRMDRIEVLVSIFGRQTPVEMDEGDIEGEGGE